MAVPARLRRLGARTRRRARRRLTARVARTGAPSPSDGFVTVVHEGVPVVARLDPQLQLAPHRCRVVESVTSRLSHDLLSWWWVPQPEGRAAALGVRASDRPRVLEALGAVTGPAGYCDVLDPLDGQPLGRWVRGRAPTGSPPGLLVWEFAAPAAGSHFVTGPGQGLEIWFFDADDAGDLTCEVRNVAVSRLRSPRTSGQSALPAPPGRRFTSTIDFPVDAVYTWVDGSDEHWLRQKAEAAGVADPTRFTERAHDEARFADHDELRYSLRSLQQFAPWVNHVWIVTADQHPAWLRRDDPWVTVVPHSAIWPDAAGLPTFNSHAIETCLHRVPGLSEHFLYLNDDVLLGRPALAEQYFLANGLGRFFWSRAMVDLLPTVPGEVASSSAAKNARTLLGERYGVTFSRKFFHTPAPLTISGLTELEDTFPDAVSATRRARFRTLDDVAMAGSLYLNWAYVTGRSVPGRVRYTYVDPAAPDAGRRLELLTRKRVFDVLCVNDGSTHESPEQRVRSDRIVREFFADYLPVPGSFEVPTTLSPERSNELGSGK